MFLLGNARNFFILGWKDKSYDIKICYNTSKIVLVVLLTLIFNFNSGE